MAQALILGAGICNLWPDAQRMIYALMHQGLFDDVNIPLRFGVSAAVSFRIQTISHDQRLLGW